MSVLRAAASRGVTLETRIDCGVLHFVQR